MKLTKAQREHVRQKFGGKCAYCGSDLPQRWHADHIEPIVRTDWFEKQGFASRGPDYPDRDVIENLNPACPPCNIDKHSMSLESWRQMIERSNEVLTRDVSTFRRALRFRLLEVKQEPVMFYFERVATRAAAHMGQEGSK